jgi:hypothetical protein
VAFNRTLNYHLLTVRWCRWVPMAVGRRQNRG